MELVLQNILLYFYHIGVYLSMLYIANRKTVCYILVYSSLARYGYRKGANPVERENTGHSFISYFKRATSPLVVLRFLSEKPMYGYEITAALKSRSDGKYMISILYPVLYRLEEQGFICISSTEVADGRARSYYSITDEGKAHLNKTWKEYLEISSIFEDLMDMPK